MQRFLITCFISISVVSGIAAQTPPDRPVNPPDYIGPVNTTGISADRPVPKQISGGVLNGKAISLPKPTYPPAARAVGASGAVTIQVLIDENGDVVSAAAVSGHPLLRAAATEAARSAKFSPTRLQDIAVKVSGVITYNFVGPLYPSRLGFALSYAERTGSFGVYSMPESLASQLHADWIAEKEILRSLTFEESRVAPVRPAEIKEVAKPAEPGSSTQPDKNRYTVIGDANFSIANDARYRGRPLDSKSLSSLQNLLGLIESRMAVSESAAWSFELGKSLGVLIAEMDDQSKFVSNTARLRSVVERAPSSVSETQLQQLKDFVEMARTVELVEMKNHDFITKAEMLSNLRY